MTHDDLTLFWTAVLAISILVYVVLDGFDLGVGMLFGLTDDEWMRRDMVDTIAPFWDGNETWLVVIGASLFAAFPVVYAVLLPAFYIPVLLMLFGLIFRGVAFEFRERSGPGMLPVWNAGFWIGSVVVAFVQGAAVGTMIDGIPVKDGQFAGGSFVWLAPFPVLCGVGLVFGYAVLGAAWLVLKSEGDLRDLAYRWLGRATLGMVAVLAVAAVTTLFTHHLALANLQDRPWALAFPALSALGLLGLWFGTAKRIDGLPFAAVVLVFLGAFLTLAAAFWPYMVPGALTVEQAAAPKASLEFLFWGAGIVALPVVAIYTFVVYWLFKGKRTEGYGRGPA